MEGEFLRKKRRGQIGASDFLFKAPKARKILSLKGDREREWEKEEEDEEEEVDRGGGDGSFRERETKIEGERQMFIFPLCLWEKVMKPMV